jgi:hypothetical protein
MARTSLQKDAEVPAEKQQDSVEAASPGGLTAAGVLALQQSGGNQMVQRILARQPATASKIDELDEMLDSFNVPEDEVIARRAEGPHPRRGHDVHDRQVQGQDPVGRRASRG